MVHMRIHRNFPLWISIRYKTHDSRTALQTVLLAIFLLCIMGVVCSLTTKALHRIILWFAPVNSESTLPQRTTRISKEDLVIGSIAICIALLVLTPNKQSASWVFTNVTDGSGVCIFPEPDISPWLLYIYSQSGARCQDLLRDF